jgi:chromosome transmission fidelity protein 1
MEARLARVRAKEKIQKERYRKDDQSHKRRKIDARDGIIDADNEAQFELDDYESDQEGSILSSHAKTAPTEGLSADTLALMDKLGMVVKPPKEDEIEIEDEIKVHQSKRNVLTTADSRVDFLLFAYSLSIDTVCQ